MRNRLAAAVLATAVAGIGLPALSVRAEIHPPAAPAKHAADQQAVPVKEVVLYTSGVGYFEHFGTVKGDGFTELHFKTQQINDILKSLLLEDLDGGARYRMRRQVGDQHNDGTERATRRDRLIGAADRDETQLRRIDTLRGKGCAHARPGATG